jgi:PAS domain-containing protein
MGGSLISRFFMLRLVEKSGRENSRTYELLLRQLPATLGGCDSCEIQLGATGILGRHAKLSLVAGDGIWISSCEGGAIRVNGAAVESVRLKEGDVIAAGETTMEFCFVPTIQNTFRLREAAIWGGIVLLTLMQLAAVYLLLP